MRVRVKRCNPWVDSRTKPRLATPGTPALDRVSRTHVPSTLWKSRSVVRSAELAGSLPGGEDSDGCAKDPREVGTISPLGWGPKVVDSCSHFPGGGHDQPD